MKELSLTIRFEGGDADEGRLPIYDAAAAITGLARSLNIVSHSFANEEEIRKQADHANGVSIQLQASQKGCFEEQVNIKFEGSVCERIGYSVITNHYWDYLTWCWSTAVGVEYEPSSTYLKKLVNSDNAIIYEIADALESSMAKLQRPIKTDSNMTMILARPRIGDIMTLDSDTLLYVSTLKEASESQNITGNVTKFSILSGFGRLYDDELKHTVSFQAVEDPSQRLKSLLVKSMQQRLKGEGGKLSFQVRAVTNAQSKVKRYIVLDVTEIHEA
ncbi:hypothetical protein [Glaciimonas sp. PCH181]|uniref:DUF7946 domain-containing protein n=1 Tax=Glaciimonas sp. PCH181 TaxID=2133943 RepID=UPI000D392FC5|nr:hypothetical protein [Glaciimonas sp. PCH181]PUA17201.1 hypothetical protein C7W93_14780 [Glaciimonas sp. PCH181]